MLYLLFAPQNTPDFILPIVCALLTGGIALSVAEYRWMSLLTIFIVGHIIAYPVGALLVMSLPDPEMAIEPEIWETTGLSMWAMVIGMIGLSIGASLINKNTRRRQHMSATALAWITPAGLNILLVLVLIPVVIIYVSLGIYYHMNVTGVEEFNFYAASTYGVIGYLVYIAYVGVALQIRRYYMTRTRRDAYYTVIAVVIPVLLFIPSGNRGTALVVITIAMPAFLAWETRVGLKWRTLAAAIMAVALLMPLLEVYRTTVLESGATSLLEREMYTAETIIAMKLQDEEVRTPDIGRIMLARRLSDHHSTGYIIDVVPRLFPHRGFEGITEWPFYLLPTLLRPTIDLGYDYDAVLMEQYGFRSETGGSSPQMIIGELYDRFGWIGIFIGMAVIGAILSSVDRWIREGSFRNIVLWTLMVQTVVHLHTFSLLKFFTLMTRQLVIFIIISFLLEYIWRHMASNTNHRDFLPGDAKGIGG